MNNIFKIKADDIFDKAEVNLGRQIELDVMKVITLFFMIGIHVQEIVFSITWEDFTNINMTNAYQVFNVFENAIVPFSFMFAMGTGIRFNKSQTSNNMIKRGFKLIISWILLNMACLFPLAYLFSQPKNMTIFQFCTTYFFYNDILFFAGAFFIYYGLIKKLNISNIGFFIISLGLFLCGHFIYFKNDSIFWQNLVGELVYTDATSFPFLNWIMAPTLGLLWGTVLTHCKNKDALYTITGIISLMVLIMILKSLDIFQIFTPERIEVYTDVNFIYRSNLIIVIIVSACIGIFISICYLISKVLNEGILKLVLFISSNVNLIYIIQWLIILWGTLLLPRPTKMYSPIVPWTLTACIFVVCVLLAKIKKKITSV